MVGRALSILRERRPDLLLLDLIMPVMDGYEVLLEMRHVPALAKIPVVVISSRDPMGEVMMIKNVHITYNNGFSTSNLIEIIQSITKTLHSVKQESHG